MPLGIKLYSIFSSRVSFFLTIYQVLKQVETLLFNRCQKILCSANVKSGQTIPLGFLKQLFDKNSWSEIQENPSERNSLKFNQKLTKDLYSQYSVVILKYILMVLKFKYLKTKQA